MRLALSWLDKPPEQIDPETDLKRVQDYLAQRDLKPATLAAYHKGLTKLAQYLRYRRNQPEPERPINWDRYLAPFSPDLANDIRAYVTHRRRAWLPEQQRQATLNLLSHLTGTLRGLGATEIEALTPAQWFDYVERRLQAGIQPGTLNRELYDLQDFLRFLAEWGRPICDRMLAVKPLDTNDPLPHDAPVSQLRQLLHQIQQDIDTGVESQRQALIDRAWVLLMLHSGLRTGEIRHLRLGDLDLDRRQVRIEQGKGLQDRMVFLSREGVEALQAYLEARGPAATDHVFIYRHRSLSSGYCNQRLRVFGRRCGIHITAHQLRYSCATLLLNAGLPVLTLQRVLGHRWIETTLRYARLYDSTVVRDYGRAMAGIEALKTANYTDSFSELSPLSVISASIPDKKSLRSLL